MHTDTIDLETWLRKRLGPATFAGFIWSARKSDDISQVKMAKILGISKSMLCDIEKGRQFVSVELAAKFARKCGMSEKYAIQLALQDQLRKAKLKYTVSVA